MSNYNHRQRHHRHFLFSKIEGQEEGEEQNLNNEIIPKQENNISTNQNNNNTNNQSNTTSRDISFQIFKLLSYIIQLMGLFFTFGLLLNLFGFGYYFDSENIGAGLRIDKREIIRNEIQFRNEMRKEQSFF